MKDFTDITVILDRSGSMNLVKESTISGFDEFVQSQKLQGGNANLTLVQFDDQYETVWNQLPIQTVPSIRDIFQPRSMTALLDAVGRTINETGARLAKQTEADRPNKVVVVIITDGMENASREFTAQKVFDMVKHQQDKYNWNFIFLGANQDAIATAVGLGMKAGWAATFNATDQGTKKAFSQVGAKMSAYRCCSSAGEALAFSAQDLYTQEDRDELVN